MTKASDIGVVELVMMELLEVPQKSSNRVAG